MPDIVEKLVEGEKEPLLTAETSMDLLTFVQFGALEFHVWGSSFNHIEEPDMVVFDLDPGPGVSWKKTIEAAEVLREFLKSLEMKSYAKLSGGKGIHVVVPIAVGSVGWEIKSLAKAIAEAFDRLVPGQFVTVMSKAKREKRIFIDYLRNGRGATSIAPYSVRSNPEASICVPIDWKDLPNITDPRQFTILNVDDWLVPIKDDPWQKFYRDAFSVKPDIWEKVGAPVPTEWQFSKVSSAIEGVGKKSRKWIEGRTK